MRLIMFTSRSKAIFVYPRCFSTLSQKSSRNPNLLSCIVLHPKPSSIHSRRSSNFASLWNSGLASSRCISSIAPSAVSTVDWNDAVPDSETAGRVDLARTEENEDTMGEVSKSSVRAFFVSTSVDLKALEKQFQDKLNVIPTSSRMTNYVVLSFLDLKPYPWVLGSSAVINGCCFMVVFQYGSVVLFNAREHEVKPYIDIVKTHASGVLHESRKDEYEVRQKRTLHTWMQGGLDYIMLQKLDIDGIRTIGSVLGQSIALDYYVRQVDGIVAEFTDINRGMEKTGTFTMERKKLFQLVGKANSNLADVILKLGLFERSDIAWKDAKYAQIWEYLRDEFELTQRFSSLDFKLKFVEHNIRFLQEILQNRKSDFLEWLIIILIGAEILISVYDIAHRSAITSL